MRRHLPALAAVGLLVAGVAVALWPLHAQGVTGNAVRPHYHSFGWYAYTPLTTTVTIADLRGAGVRVPQDDVDGRRRVAGALAAGGLIVGAGAVIARARASSGG